MVEVLAKLTRTRFSKWTWKYEVNILSIDVALGSFHRTGIRLRPLIRSYYLESKTL